MLLPALLYLLLARHVSARGPFFTPSSTDTETSWFLTPPPSARAHLGSTVNITWHSDRAEVRLLLHKRGYAGAQYISDVVENRWFAWTVSSDFGSDVKQPFALQALESAGEGQDWWSPMFYLVEAETKTAASGGTLSLGASTAKSTSLGTAVCTSLRVQYTLAPEDDPGSRFDHEGLEMRRIAGLVAGVVLGSIAVVLCLALCLWRIRRRQPGGARASTAARGDEVIKTETRAELPAERSVLDVSNFDEFAARYS
ncbi:hypothetical protein HBH70_049240 [Parastagonospora nodorum]|nr:hypothetical protein HBH43_065250 [Parastagonospora nodorum]KAH4212327.1 hypothetical protein HBI95_035930 [Parastagonospora nodorum]KAH4958582.1 hypothetical protein HBI78_177810 [Parastagonospora nodorum]KAH5146131.1 hypothetical protein HBH70_049240 [Parastagonospora nodorum]KAH5288960.1 hypothetical protein HBI11_234880 [Parastagonospora nodorum]